MYDRLFSQRGRRAKRKGQQLVYNVEREERVDIAREWYGCQLDNEEVGLDVDLMRRGRRFYQKIRIASMG